MQAKACIKNEFCKEKSSFIPRRNMATVSELWWAFYFRIVGIKLYFKSFFLVKVIFWEEDVLPLSRISYALSIFRPVLPNLVVSSLSYVSSSHFYDIEIHKKEMSFCIFFSSNFEKKIAHILCCSIFRNSLCLIKWPCKMFHNLPYFQDAPN